MAAAIVTIICIAMIIVGGMTLSHGILTSADTAAQAVDSISVREGDIMRTDVETIRAAQMSWADYLRVTVKNNGQTKLASFDKWDFIVTYTDSVGASYEEWLPFTTSLPGNNQWQEARIGLDGPVEYFEPGILNPAEQMVILAKLYPLPIKGTGGTVSIATPNGVYASVAFDNPAITRFTPQSENVTMGGNRYYELVEASPADGPATICETDFTQNQSGRQILANPDLPTRQAKYVYPLLGITQIPASTWTAYYRVKVDGDGFPQADNDVCFNIDIVVRQANGAIRTVLASGVANAYVNQSDTGTWVTISGTYDFPGYTVVDENDYLEIDYYGQTNQGPSGAAGTMQLSIDNYGLGPSDQTRIEP